MPGSDDQPTQDTDSPTYVWNPIDFRPEDYLDEALLPRADLARYFLHSVYLAAVRGGRDGYVSLKAAYLRKMFPGTYVYKQVRDGLIRSGAIACDRHYIEGKKSYGYRLGPALAAMRQHRVRVADPTLIWKLRANRDEHIRVPEPVHRHLLDHLQRVEVDYPAALDWLLGCDDFEPAHETGLRMLSDREFHFGVCSYGRVHTNLTNLRSGLRGFLSYRGSPLVNLDIRNSQPLFFAILLREHYGADGGLPADVERYIELVQAGRFYDHLMDRAGIPAGDRGEFKRRFFGHVFFCENSPETDAARAFGAQFPSVYAAIRSMKAQDYRALAHRLQRAESDLMIGGVARRCMDELPATFLGTIHDSILTTPDRADAIRSLMHQEFTRIGLRPTINIEELGRPGSQGALGGVAS